MAKQKSKSMRSKEGGRKLAVGAGRKKRSQGGEPKKPKSALGGSSSRRTGSSKQRKG